MDKATIQKIAYQQTQRFFYSYPRNWRWYQLAAVEKKLEERFSFYLSMVQTTIDSADPTAVDGVIAQEITNGLYFEGIAIAIQAIEDLFALLYAGGRPLRFISGIITYSAGKIKNLISKKLSREDVATLFFFPLVAMRPDEKAKNVVESHIDRLVATIQDLKSFYTRFEFFYNQYKHGLCVVRRAFVDYSPKQIEDDRPNWKSRHLFVFDNLSLTKLEPEVSESIRS